MATLQTALRQLDDAFTRLAEDPPPWPGHEVLGPLTIATAGDNLRRGHDREPTTRALVELAGAGDATAGLVAIWGLTPLLWAKVQASPWRMELHASDGELLSTAYLVMATIDPTLDRLGCRIVRRTIDRTTRRLRTLRREQSLDTLLAPAGGRPDSEPAHHLAPATSIDAVERETLGRLTVAELCRAVGSGLDTGSVTPEGWALVVASRLHGVPSADLAARRGGTPEAARVAVHRTTARLRTLVDVA